MNNRKWQIERPLDRLHVLWRQQRLTVWVKLTDLITNPQRYLAVSLPTVWSVIRLPQFPSAACNTTERIRATSIMFPIKYRLLFFWQALKDLAIMNQRLVCLCNMFVEQGPYTRTKTRQTPQ